MYLLICQNNCGSKNEINILNVIIHYDIASYTQLVWLGWWIAGLNYICYGYHLIKIWIYKNEYMATPTKSV